jgi:hypothetical protein
LAFGGAVLTGFVRLSATVALFLALSRPALAAPSIVVNPGDAVPGHPGMTYVDLVRLAIPDLAMNAADNQLKGHFTAPLRNLAGKDYENGLPDPAVLGFMQARPILVGGKRRLLLLADLGAAAGVVDGTALLMLVDDGPKPRLLDAADVSLDKDSEFADAPLLKLGPGDEAVVTYSEHDDADLTMGGYMIVSPVGDRLRMVDKVAITSEKLCSWTGIETPTFTTAPDPGRPYRRIVLTMKAAFTHTDEDGCTDEKHPKAGVFTFRAVYRWNTAAKRFGAATSNLRGLAALNDKAF